MSTNDYNPLTALTAYYVSRAERRLARLWATEKLLHDLKAIGMIDFFEGPGSDPTALEDYSSAKLWLQVASGITDEPGTVRMYDGTGDESQLSNWPPVSGDAILTRYLGPITADQIEEGDDTKIMTAAERAKLAALTGGVIQNKGNWDASSGSFPGAGAALSGWAYIVTTGGTVDGVSFAEGDRLIAIADSASTTTFAANWFKDDNTDLVTSVASKTGIVVLELADVVGLVDALAARGLKAPETRALTGTSEALELADAGKIVTMSNSNPNTLTIPAQADVAWADDTVIQVLRLGSGVTSIAGATGVTLNGVSAGTGAMPNQYQGVSLKRISEDVWVASGDIETVA